MSDFETWWSTEPFGYDHPETKEGIRKLLQTRDVRIKELEAQLKEAEEVIGYYGDTSKWFYPGNDFHNFHIAITDVSKSWRFSKAGNRIDVTCGGKRARAYQEKWGKYG